MRTPLSSNPLQAVAGTPDEVLIFTCLTEPGALLRLACDVNGNHVIGRGLQLLSPQHTSWILEGLTACWLAIARHWHGCVVIQVSGILIGQFPIR